MATVNRYVNPASSGGDGTTPALSGAAAAYASLIAWESGEDTNLVTDGDIHICHCQGGLTTESGQIDLNQWTTGVSNYIEIVVDSGHRSLGVPSAGFRVTISSGSWVFVNREEYTRFRFLEAYGGTGGVMYPDVNMGGAAVGDIRIEGCHFTPNAGDYGIRPQQSVDSIYIFNTVIDCNANNANVGIENSGSSTVYIYSSTIVGGIQNGIRSNNAGAIVNCKNVISDDNDINDFIESLGTLSCDYCASGDDTADDQGGSGNQINQTFVFEDKANGDYHLDSTDAGAKDLGTDTSGEGAPLNFDDDIDIITRAGTWDIGADEIVAAGGADIRRQIIAAYMRINI